MIRSIRERREKPMRFVRSRNVVLALVLVFSVLFSNRPVQAAGDQMIRVALFIDGRGTVPAVTLSSPQGLAVGVDKHPSWYQHQSAQPLRFSLHEYRLKSAPISDKATAFKTAQSMMAVTGNADVRVNQTGSQTSYTVYAGHYADKAAASAAMAKVPGAVKVTGPHHMEAAIFPSEAEAKALMSELAASGLQATLVIRPGSDSRPVYAVWVGEEADAQGLEAVKAQVFEVRPDLKLSVADTERPFLYIWTEVRENVAEPVRHVSIPASGQAIKVTSSGNIRVEERFARTYRGDMELRAWKGRLAVINELPLESYLYSVVSVEMGGGWPLEALKAQAVAARTFALRQGVKYEIAHVSDSTFDQAYYGVGYEAEDAIRAVDETRGETLRDRHGQLIEPVYSANAGGMTAAASEVWKQDLSYLKPVSSPDHAPEKSRLMWNLVALPDGTIGYVRSDYTRDTGKTSRAGFPVLEATADNVNVRPAPYVDDAGNAPLTQISRGDRLVLLEQRIESNPYRWVRGPFSAAEMERVIRERTGTEWQGPLVKLEVSGRGPSGRVTEMKANGVVIKVANADAYRSAMNGLPSTRFEVEQTGVYTILGANGKRVERTSGPVYVAGGSGSPERGAKRMVAIDQDQHVRVLTEESAFRFIGMGLGHGVGMSQWGARELAETMQYDYKQILEYYYHDVTIVKEG